MNNIDIKTYEDIINLSHHISDKHPQMTIDARAAQFAPFAALTGYSEAIADTENKAVEKYRINGQVPEK